MVKSKEQNENSRSTTITVTTEDGRGNAILAAWKGIYHLFGGRASFAVTPDGVIVNDFSVSGEYDPERITQDVSHRNRRLDLLEVYPWIQGEAPEPFSKSEEITQWTVQFMRGAVDENSSRAPKYVRDASATYKSANNFAKKRGPRRKVFRVDNLSEIDETTLSGINPVELAKLKESLEKAMALQSTNTGESTTPTAEAVPA